MRDLEQILFLWTKKIMLKISNKDYTHIHNHTEYSAFDGLNKISSFPMEARKMGFRSLGITDHGNVGGLIKFFNE